MFLNFLIYVFEFLNIYKNKYGIRPPQFAAGVIKLWPPDEIRRFDGTHLLLKVKFKF